ncbi:hypothetical protein [Metabacillus sp. SLBN-84]
MGFFSHIDSNVLTLAAGGLMLLGSFATIKSGNASKFDHDFALILLIAGVVSLGFGFGLIDPGQIKALWPS